MSPQAAPAPAAQLQAAPVGWLVRDAVRLGSQGWWLRPTSTGTTTEPHPDGVAPTGDITVGDGQAHQAGPEIAWSTSDPGFSARESEMLLLLSQGLTNQEIARRSSLSINSVKSHIRTAYRKIGVKTRTQAMLWAFDHGFRPSGAGRTWEHVAANELTRAELTPAQP